MTAGTGAGGPRRAAPSFVVDAGADEVARRVAHRLVERLRAVQEDGRVLSVVLTGGSIAEQIHAAVLAAPGAGEVDWGRVEVWWGDERFVPADDEQRNARQARRSLLAHLPLDEARVHEMPASDGAYGDDVDAAAASYARDLERVLGPSFAEGRGFDVLMLGIGPDGHCASLFPGRDELLAQGRTVAVRDSPKPPPTRISLTMSLLEATDEVWFVAAGAPKAEAVARSAAGGDVASTPAAGPRGRYATRYFLDEAAGGLLPRSLRG
jgi:6-phosphogluconolactonase